MNIFLKKLSTPQDVREMIVATPDGAQDLNIKTSSIMVLLDNVDINIAEDFLKKTGMEKLVDEGKIMVLFPKCEGVWNYDLDEEKYSDIDLISSLSSQLNSGTYTNGFRSINDVHYLLGIDSGASMINTLVSVRPEPYLAAAVCIFGGVFSDKALEKAKYSPVPALLINADKKAAEYYIKANNTEQKENDLWQCSYNENQKVKILSGNEFTQEFADIMWNEFFKVIRRTNTSPEGDVDRRLDPDKCGFIWHFNDTCLHDNDSLPHDFIEHVPQSVKDNPNKKVPLVIFSHGASDSPFKAADMIKMHEIGEREGFITVYPLSCNRNMWNLAMDESVKQGDDVGYYLALIEYLKNKYPIDETRIYTSGFSNGAGMAMVFALAHPEIVAACAPVDSTFPYATMGRFRPAGFGKQFVSEYIEPGKTTPKHGLPPMDAEKNLKPLKKALESQNTKRYVMPVLYFYGTRESEYPIGPGTNQELSQEFWKTFNEVPVKPMQDNLEPDAIGVCGDEVYTLYPDAAHPSHMYKKHVFFTKYGKDYYNIMLMYGKAHDVHPIEREFCWEFLSRFSRMPDGELVDTKDKA